MATTKRKASGRYIGDDERGTVKVTLRLAPELAERLKDVHAHWKREDKTSTLGDVLEAALDALGAAEANE